jgi:hypothetical protein
MTSGIIEILIENAGLQALIGVDSEGNYKVYPAQPPQTEDQPFIVVAERSLNPYLSKGCPSTMDSPQYVVAVYSIDFRETELIQEACRLALDNGQSWDTDAGVHFDSVYMIDRSDAFEPGTGQGMFVKIGIYQADVNRTIT